MTLWVQDAWDACETVCVCGRLQNSQLPCSHVFIIDIIFCTVKHTKINYHILLDRNENHTAIKSPMNSISFSLDSDNATFI